MYFGISVLLLLLPCSPSDHWDRFNVFFSFFVAVTKYAHIWMCNEPKMMIRFCDPNDDYYHHKDCTLLLLSSLIWNDENARKKKNSFWITNSLSLIFCYSLCVCVNIMATRIDQVNFQILDLTSMWKNIKWKKISHW